MSSEKYPITKDGYKELETELHDLKAVQRPVISEEIAIAREHGDLKENAEYHAARDKQSFIEGRISELESMVAGAEVIDVEKLEGDEVKFGAYVKLLDMNTEKEVTYRIVGEYEANMAKKWISIKTPVARALIGKKKGDEVDVTTPGGVKEYDVLKVSFSS